MLLIGTIIFCGVIFGEIATKFKLPKITGYILAGVFLNPNMFHFIPEDFTAHTKIITNISLSFISFSILHEISSCCKS